MQAFLTIVLAPDNLPVVGLLVLVVFFVGAALRMGHRNDRLLNQGGRDALLDDMRR